ncbi:MAG: pyridoxal phosphate-dependent aminotransferase [Clostridiales bacterium]|nr:pyridoxal phosphate-dependent aminotransferase [Clostridiales bacterium]
MKLSKKCAAVSPSMTLAITSKAKAMKKQGINVISFSAGEPDFNTPQHIMDAGKKAMDDGYTKYTPASGLLELKKAIADEFVKIDLQYEPSQIVVSNGAKHSLFNTMQAVLEAGDEVLIPQPYWVSYPELVKLADAVPVFVETGDDFLATVADLKAKLTSKTKALILTNPSNPTGAIYNKEQLEDIAAFCVANQIIVISDEIYDKLVYEDVCPPSIASFDGMKDLTIVINGASKAYAMTGWRIGWAAAPQNVASAMGALQSHATSNPNTIAQWATVAALTDNRTMQCSKDMNKAFKQRRNYMMETISEMKYADYVQPGGAFYMMVDVSAVFGKQYNGRQIQGSLDFSDVLLEEKYVATVPGIAFGADNYVRLSYATSMDNIKEGLMRLDTFLKEAMEA